MPRALAIEDIQIDQRAVSPNGSDFVVKAIDREEGTLMDEKGTWLFFTDCDFPRYGVVS